MIMAKYIDGFVLVVPKNKASEYKKMAKEGVEAWMRHGALSYFECKGDDLKTKGMGGMPAPLAFTKLAKSKSSEDVWFSFIVYKSRKHRDEVNKKVMDEMNEKYKDMDPKDFKMPFDTKRMATGGFEVVVEG
jgi:uncharacterized protein YbaA (DUF1428 family)